MTLISCSNTCPKTDEELIKFGKKSLCRYYGITKVNRYDPYKIVKDSNNIILIEGTLPDDLIGGVPAIKINKMNCQILNYYHTK